MTYPTIKMKITPAPKLRGKMDVRFPANVEASAPIVLDKSGGTFTFSLDVNSLSAVQSVVAGSNVTVDNTDPRNPVVSASASGTGDFSSNTSSSVDGEVVLFSGTGGKTGKRATGTGIAKLTSGVLGTATAGTDYYNPGGTDVAIADGGTGASTAEDARTNLGAQASDAFLTSIAALGTAADRIIYTTAADTAAEASLTPAMRALLASSSHNALLSGILPSRIETGAVANNLLDRLRQKISVVDFGAVGDGTTDDSTKIQAAENARAAVGGILYFESGKTYLFGSSVTVNRALGGGWASDGTSVLKAGANSVVFASMSGAAISSSTRRFRLTGLTFDGNGYTGVRGSHETSPYNTKIDDNTYIQLSFCASFTGPNSTAQTGWIFIDNIQQFGGGSWAFYGYDDTRYIFHISINGIHQKGTGSATWENGFWFEGRRSVGLSMVNVWSGSLDGGAVGLRLRGDCQGVFVNNTTFVWPTIGIEALTWTDTLKPAYVYLSNIGVDQHTISGAEIEGRTWFITNANFANGYVRTNTGQACLLKSTCTDISIVNALFAYDQKSGLVVQNGAKKIRVGNFTAENNNQAAGSNYEVDLGASPFTDVILHGRNVIGSAGVNATGQRVVNGVTSNEVSRNNTPSSTTAVTTAEDLMTYVIPAGFLKIGQKVRVKAWGGTGANGNTKTGRLYFGSSIGGYAGALNNVGWVIEAEFCITGTSSQSYVRKSLTSSVQVTSGTLSEATASSITVKFQGQNGTASAGDITCNGMTVEILD